MWAYILQNPYEVGGFVTSLICVWLNIHERVWGWFWAIVSAGFSAKLFYDQRLFGDMYLQVFFVGSALYGIYAWLYGGRQATQLVIKHASTKEWAIITVSMFVTFIALVYGLAHLKGDAIYIDALTTTLSIVGQLMLARKLIENWAVWILANGLYVVLYLQKGLYLYAFLYCIFIVLAIQGWLHWQKLYNFRNE
jgi:nicotinamide mononucleotide transporter